MATNGLNSCWLRSISLLFEVVTVLVSPMVMTFVLDVCFRASLLL